MARKITTTVSLLSGTPFGVELEPRNGTTPLFRVSNVQREGALDSSWIPDLVALLQEAEAVAKRLDDTPVKARKKP